MSGSSTGPLDHARTIEGPTLKCADWTKSPCDVGESCKPIAILDYIESNIDLKLLY